MPTFDAETIIDLIRDNLLDIHDCIEASSLLVFDKTLREWNREEPLPVLKLKQPFDNGLRLEIEVKLVEEK